MSWTHSPITKIKKKTRDKSLVQKFLSLIDKEKLVVFKGDFLTLVTLLDWFVYYDRNKIIRNAYPIFWYKKGQLPV
jgi:hypothetical protein